MNIDAAISALRAAHDPPLRPYTLPVEAAVVSAEQQLGIQFPSEYREFLLRASDVCVGTYELAILPPDAGHCDLFQVAHDAWHDGVDRRHLAFCADNGDYFCFTPSGEVVFWSHDGAADERWPSLADWIYDEWLPSADPTGST